MGKSWALGRLKGKQCNGKVKLSIESEVTDQSIPLVHVLTLNGRQLKANKDALLRLLEDPTQQPAVGVGSVAWRKQIARAAANARHNPPGGSRDKQRQIHEIRATGQYSTRDLCAEEEYAALGMSLYAAR